MEQEMVRLIAKLFNDRLASKLSQKTFIRQQIDYDSKCSIDLFSEDENNSREDGESNSEEDSENGESDSESNSEEAGESNSEENKYSSEEGDNNTSSTRQIESESDDDLDLFSDEDTPMKEESGNTIQHEGQIECRYAIFSSTKVHAMEGLTKVLSACDLKATKKEAIKLALKTRGVWYESAEDEKAKLPTVVCITGDTSKFPEVLEIVASPNEYLKKCFLFVANSAIANAIDIQIKFSYVFAYAQPGACSVTDFTQLLQRVRHKHCVFIGCSGAVNGHGVRTELELESAAYLRRTEYKQLFTMPDASECHLRNVVGLDESAIEKLLAPDPCLMSLYTHYTVEREMSKANFMCGVLYSLLRSKSNVQFGYEFAPVRSDVDDLLADAHAEYTADISAAKQEQLQAIINAPTITSGDYYNLLKCKKTNQLSAEENASITKYYIENLFCQNLTEVPAKTVKRMLTRNHQISISNGLRVMNNTTMDNDSRQILNKDLERGNNISIKQHVLDSLLKAVGFKDGCADRTSVLAGTQKELQKSREYKNIVAEFADQIERTFTELCERTRYNQRGWRKGDVTLTLNQLAKEMGMKFVCKQKGKGKNRTYCFKLDHSELEAIVARKQQKIDEQEPTKHLKMN